MSQRAFPWKAIVIGGATLAVVGLIGGYLWVMRSVVQAYYLAEYAPQPLTEADLGQAPPTHRLADVVWSSEQQPLAFSHALLMQAAQQGRVEQRSSIDFFGGFTWGATAIPRRTGFFPGQDAEVATRRAATMLGFERRYLTTDSSDDFVHALKTFLSKGRAVRVAVDRALLLDQRGSVPHAIVLVGYDDSSFEYYEPTCDDEKRCKAGTAAAGSPGLKVTNSQLLIAAESLSLVYQYPWKYQLVVLEPSAGATPELTTLLTMNGRALVGLKTQGPSLGSVLVEDTAKAIQRHGDDVVTPELLRGVRLAGQVRAENALALTTLFASKPELAPAAEALDAASKRYASAATLLEVKHLEQGVPELIEAAKLDRAAGDVLVAIGDAGVR
ncbi:MAG: BtrH N-terminal domain-containing protein [Archangiaceae bacterium]|nr:BtrH N-terminal domain-containing protein [Archangiaceae bacterium]